MKRGGTGQKLLESPDTRAETDKRHTGNEANPADLPGVVEEETRPTGIRVKKDGYSLHLTYYISSLERRRYPPSGDGLT